MQPKAIIYTSNTGHTKQYAEMLGQAINVPVLETKEALRSATLNAQDSIVYMGWLMAGIIKGFKKIRNKFNVVCLCGVGMSPDESQKQEIIKANHLDRDAKIFILQGGFELDKLSGIYKLMMGTMKGTLGKRLQEKEDKTDEEKDMLDLLINGGNRVSKEKLQPVIDYLNS